MGREYLEYGIPLRTVDAANDPSLFSDVSEGERVGHAERLVGQLVDQRYELRRLIAVGAAGAVFDACQTGLGRRVALKLMQSQGDPAADADLRRRVKLEAETLARLAHPNVVGVFDVGVWRGQSFLVMEMLTGRTLSEVLREVRRMPLGRLIPIARQICRALDVTHRAGVIHRDLKPSNVMITAFGDVLDHVKLVDFGVAKDLRAASQLTVQGTMLGTPKYMAPEQISCDAEAIGPATDIYALGALLYRASIGRGVFPGLQGVQQLVAHVREPPPPFDEALPGHGLPRRFEEVVLQCLSKRPQDRFSSARALEAELAEIEARLTPADFGAPKVAPRPAPASLAAHERTMFTQMSPALAEVEPLPEVEVELEAAPGWAAWRAAVVAAAVIVGGLAGLGVARSPGELAADVPRVIEAAPAAIAADPAAVVALPAAVAPVVAPSAAAKPAAVAPPAEVTRPAPVARRRPVKRAPAAPPAEAPPHVEVAAAPAAPAPVVLEGSGRVTPTMSEPSAAAVESSHWSSPDLKDPWAR